MKNKYIHTTTLLLTCFAALAFAGCAKRDREKAADKTREVYADAKSAVKEAAYDTKDAVVTGWDNLKDFTFEKRDAFTATLKARQADFEAGASKLRAEYSEANASASRKAAMAELENAEANYKEKFAAVGHATADTWTAARDDVAAAWDRLQASYAKARAGE